MGSERLVVGCTAPTPEVVWDAAGRVNARNEVPGVGSFGGGQPRSFARARGPVNAKRKRRHGFTVCSVDEPRRSARVPVCRGSVRVAE